MIYFVTEQFIKTKTNITQNVDAKDLAPFIPLSVKTYIQPILGYRFTEDLLSKFNAGTTSAEEDELIEFIQYTTAFYSAFDAVAFLSFRVSNKGLQSQAGDYSTSEGIQAVEYIRQNILKFAKVHEGNLREFLHLNYKEFPLYKDPINQEISAPDGERTFRSDTTWL